MFEAAIEKKRETDRTEMNNFIQRKEAEKLAIGISEYCLLANQHWREFAAKSKKKSLTQSLQRLQVMKQLLGLQNVLTYSVLFSIRHAPSPHRTKFLPV
jgi:hypothetical protein